MSVATARAITPSRWLVSGLSANAAGLTVRFKFLPVRTRRNTLPRCDAFELFSLICEQRYAIFVPQRLVPTRGALTIKDALLGCPHAAIGGDGQLMLRLREFAQKLGGVFIPELECDSIGQCVAAVETGSFAAVLPVHAWTASSEKDYVVVEDESLEVLNRQIVLAWHPRTIEVMGPAAQKIRQALADALKQRGAHFE